MFGTGAAVLINSVTPIAASVPPLAVVAALATSCVTGMLFGTVQYPVRGTRQTLPEIRLRALERE